MRSMKRLLASLLLLAMLVTSVAMTFVGCTGDDVNPEETTGSSNGGSPDGTDKPSSGNTTPDLGETKEYTVTIKSVGGMAMKGVSVYVYLDNDLAPADSESGKAYGVTDENGKITLKMSENDTYRIILSKVPEGYDVADEYSFDAERKCDILLKSDIIMDENISDVQYKVGDVMHDFSVIDTEGNTHRLSEILKTKKGVMLNFWFSTCSPCVNEFPYMNEAYNTYKDEFEILALNHYPTDDENSIKLFKQTMELDMPMAKDYTKLQGAFNVGSYPTSIFIDRYGVICLIEVGGLTSIRPFNCAFEHFTADDYEQKLFTSISELTPKEKPTYQMPTSDDIASVLNKGEINVTYRGEVGEDAEYAWPFIIDKETFDKPVIKPSNIGVDDSFAIMYADVTMKAGEALALDYLASSEPNCDVLFLLVDNKDIYQISNKSDDWKTCYPFVALEDGTYELAFVYMKDESTAVYVDGENNPIEFDDTVYLRDLRIVKDLNAIDVPSYIPRYAATHPAATGYGYEKYVDVVLGEDGYYHVGTANGPLLLANLLGASRFANDSVYSMASQGMFVVDGKNYLDDITPYCNFASNATITGHCTVTAELKDLLEKFVGVVGIEKDNPNQWLQLCVYYDAYGTNGVQLEDPIAGLTPFSAYDAVEGMDIPVVYNRVIMPRGMYYKFVPEKSGVYRINSNSKYEVNAWIFTAKSHVAFEEYFVYSADERELFLNSKESGFDPTANCSMVVYMEAGKEYYINIAFYDPYKFDEFTFTVEYEAETLELLKSASPGFFTYYESEDGDVLNEIVAGGVNVALGDDGYYHELRADGSLGSILYADFTMATNIFAQSIMELIEAGSFDFTMSAEDMYIKDIIDSKGAENTVAYLRELWGSFYDGDGTPENPGYGEIYKVDDCLKGIWHGLGGDYTEEMRAYAQQMITGEAPELEGCVKVDARLAEILQKLMDKYTFSGVDHSWTKLCYYYDSIGPVA